MKLLIISGSLRASSSNTALVHAAIAVAPADLQVEFYDALGELPHFNPDADGESVAESVTQWREALSRADGVIFSTPEYAHGVPGVLKNALDWLVGSGELAGKPVALFNASARAAYAQASLTGTLTVMSAQVVAEACLTLPLLGATRSASEIAADPEMSATLRRGLQILAHAIGQP